MLTFLLSKHFRKCATKLLMKAVVIVYCNTELVSPQEYWSGHSASSSILCSSHQYLLLWQFLNFCVPFFPSLVHVFFSSPHRHPLYLFECRHNICHFTYIATSGKGFPLVRDFGAKRQGTQFWKMSTKTFTTCFTYDRFSIPVLFYNISIDIRIEYGIKARGNVVKH